MKAALSLPDALLEEAEAAAKDLGASRSRLIRIALEAFLARRHEEAVTTALNRSLARHADEVDPVVQYFGLETLERTEWRE